MARDTMGDLGYIMLNAINLTDDPIYDQYMYWMVRGGYINVRVSRGEM